MDYKEKVIALLNSQELSKEQKEKLENIFPELKESEDERMKKALYADIRTYIPNERGDKYIAWLEKQSGKKSADEVLKIRQELYQSGYNDGYKHGQEDMVNKESDNELTRKSLINFLKSPFVHENITDEKVAPWIAWLEKQGETFSDFKAKDWYVSKVDGKIYNITYNPTDKVESKFKVSNWVVWDNKITCHIDSIYQGKESLMYSITDTNNMTRSYSVKGFDNNAHLWTIEDAKDGDVLVIQKTNVTYEAIFIFNKIENNCIIQYLHYFTTDADEEVCEVRSFDGFLGFVGTTVHPATKEQRDTLMKAMTEAGYTFDFEKKELKKIEPKFKHGDRVRNKKTGLEQTLGSCIEDVYEGAFPFRIKDQDDWELIEQNPAWNEEDETKLKSACALIRNTSIKGNDSIVEIIVDWLKSLKEKVLPQNIAYYNPYKEVVESIAEMCKHYDKASHSGLRDFYDNVKVKCKDAKEYNSLFPQSTWKPSEEQMDALDYYANSLTTYCDRQDDLRSLFNALKKL